MIKKILTRLTLTLIFAPQLHALIYQIDVYKSVNGAIIFLCKDEHTSCSDNNAGKKQFQVIKQFLKTHNNKAKIILECDGDYQGNDQAWVDEAQNLRSAASASDDIHLLTNLFSYCKKNNITCTNIDHRFFNEQSLYGAASISSVLQSFDASVQEIKSFTSTSINSFYQQVIHDTTVEDKEFIDQLRATSEKTLKQLHQAIPNKKQKQRFINYCATLGNEFLNARLLNALENHTSSESAAAFIGGDHIDAITPQLALIGLTYSHSLGQEPTYEDGETISAETLLNIDEFKKQIALADTIRKLSSTKNHVSKKLYKRKQNPSEDCSGPTLLLQAAHVLQEADDIRATKKNKPTT